MKPTLMFIFSFLFIGIAIGTYAIKNPEITDPVPVHEVLALPVIITQDDINKHKYFIENKWYGTLDPNEEGHARLHCENGANVNKHSV
ncbi:1903_t:CDS:2, partial [Dentiscutata heterogama]